MLSIFRINSDEVPPSISWLHYGSFQRSKMGKKVNSLMDLERERTKKKKKEKHEGWRRDSTQWAKSWKNCNFWTMKKKFQRDPGVKNDFKKHWF